MSQKINKKIWHISSNRWNSAITEYALSSMRALNYAGYQQIFSPLLDSPAMLRAQKYNIAVRPLKNFGLAEWREFRNLYHEIQPDYIFVYEGKEQFLAQLCIHSNKTKLIRFRGRDVHVQKIEPSWKTRISNLKTSCILTPAQVVKDKVYSQNKIKVVQLGVDANFFSRQTVSKLHRPELLIFGRLDPIKGHREFLAIYSKFLQKIPEGINPILHIAGAEENIKVADIKYAAEQHHLTDDHIKFTIGRVPNPTELLSQATLGVISSLGSEVICRVAQEFLLCGTPIFTSGVGALTEIELANSVFHYKNLSIEQASDLLVDVFMQSLKESEHAKFERATAARKVYSIEAMSQSLSTLLLNL